MALATQVDGFGQAVRQAHMDWLHLPIRDVSAPSIAFEKSWRAVGPGIRSRLRADFDVVVHFKGGLGQAGLVACRMLIDCGMVPEQALAAVRAGAISTSTHPVDGKCNCPDRQRQNGKDADDPCGCSTEPIIDPTDNIFSDKYYEHVHRRNLPH